MTYVEYDSNNSGGSWWLDDNDWKALEAAGWIVEWASTYPHFVDGEYVRDEDGVPILFPEPQEDRLYTKNPNGRWLGALAKGAFRKGLSLRAAVDEWERITGESSTDAGCPCCGNPHKFYERDANGRTIASGPEARYTATWE